MLQPNRFPFTHTPTSWYVVAYSDELPAGAVQPLRYFGRDLVLYRAETGEPVVLGNGEFLDV